MPCRSPSALARLTRARVRIPCVVLAALIPGLVVLAQQPSTPAATYHPPIIVLAAPITGSAIPADKPVIVLRFSAGEQTDAVDPSTLRMSVDGEDRSSLLQLGTGEAWGPLARENGSSPASGGVKSPAAPLIAPGVHLLHVRLCSMRGVCSTLDAPVAVAPAEPPQTRSATPADSSGQQRSRDSKLRKALDFLIAGARKLLTP